MKKRSTSKYCFLCLLAIFFIAGCAQKPATLTTVEVTEPTPQNALCYAKQQLDKPYTLGGQGPDEFDCSGLIICAYEDALQAPLSLMNKRNEICGDVTVDELYKYNVRLLQINEVVPGDIVFTTKDEKRITHGGLFIGWKDENTIEFINASYYFGKVCIAEWPLDCTKRGQWVAGFGRLKIREMKKK